MAAGGVPEAAAAGGRGSSPFLSRSWADWAEEEEGEGQVELPVSLAPPLLGDFWAAAWPARRWGQPSSRRGRVPARPPLRRPAVVAVPAPAAPRPAAPPGLSPVVAPVAPAGVVPRAAAAGDCPGVGGPPLLAVPAACVSWSGPARAARMRGLAAPCAAEGTTGTWAGCRPNGPRTGGLDGISAQEVAEAARRAREVVGSINRAWGLAHADPARWIWVQRGGSGPWAG
ncbi:translation initiation factor IF-2 [Triticum aestivum]|uniref:translation initiation factor IF-2 n=1 Tax=Triticum aestivum TaxID=4565 RepID=UPI001D022ABD|nr:translation initiation factor IF-2-like [Triticum aestivum]